jgi:hypothetical protein
VCLAIVWTIAYRVGVYVFHGLKVWIYRTRLHFAISANTVMFIDVILILVSAYSPFRCHQISFLQKVMALRYKCAMKGDGLIRLLP